MSDVQAIVARRFAREGGELVVGGMRVSELAERFGTPLFVYDRGVLARVLAELREALGPRFDVYYSIKANPNQTILRTFVAHGCGLELASAGELHQALAAGVAPGRTLFAGPGKTDAELDAAVRRGVGEIHAESLDEIDRLGAIAERAGRVQAVAVRINPAGEAQGGAMRMGGKPAAFGIDEERLDDAVDRVLTHPSLHFSGVHLFTGTQILDAEVLIRQYAKAIEIAVRAARRSGRPLETLDFGGGLGIPYYAGEAPLDLARYGEVARALAEDAARLPELAGTRFVVEPGRFLVGEAGVYVARVTTVKESRGKRFAILDGGMHHHLAASGNLGQVIKKNYPVAALGKLDALADSEIEVCGPLCTPLDVLARNARLPALAAGDLVGVFQSGAYARAASPLGFLSHPAPPEVMVADGEATLVRERASLEAFLSDQTVGERR